MNQEEADVERQESAASADIRVSPSINPTQEATTVPESDEILPIINQVQPPLITQVDTVAAQVDILVARRNPVSKSGLEHGLVKATAVFENCYTDQVQQDDIESL